MNEMTPEIKHDKPGRIESQFIGGIRFIHSIYGKDLKRDLVISFLDKFLSIFHDQYTLSKFWPLIKDKYFDNEYSPIFPRMQEDIDTFNSNTDRIFAKRNIRRVFATIVGYDLRESICLLYVFGLLPWIKNTREFQRRFEVDPSFIEFNAKKALSQLEEDLSSKEFEWMKITSTELANFFNNLRNVSAKDLLYFTNGKLMFSGSEVYRLARFISQGKEPLIPLHFNEQILLDTWSNYYKEAGVFLTIRELASIIGKEPITTHTTIRDILKRIENNRSGLSEYRIDDRVYPIDFSLPHAKVILVLKNNPKYINHPYLNDEHVAMLVTYQNMLRAQFYPSLNLLAQELGATETYIEKMFLEILSRFNRIEEVSEDFYLDPEGQRLLLNDPRVVLLNSYESTELRQQLDPELLNILDLLMKNKDRRFLFTLEDMVTILKIESKEPIELLKSKIQKILNIKNKLESGIKIQDPSDYLDHRGLKIKPNDSRLLLISIYKDNNFRILFLDRELEALDLYLTLEGNQFLFSQNDVARRFEYKDSTAVEVFIKKAVSIATSNRLVNEEGRPLKPQHTEAVRRIEQIGLKALFTKLNRTESLVAISLVQKENGRYLSYKLIAERLTMDLSTVKRTVRRILDKINLEN